MNIDAPEPRNLAQEGRDTLKTQIELAPEQYASTAKYQPMYADLMTRIAGNTILGHDGVPGVLNIAEEAAPWFARINAAGNTAAREADVGDIEKYGGRATEAILKANPYNYKLLERLNSAAAADLELGDQLDPAERRQIEQSVRAAQASRGMGMGPSAVVNETLAKSRGGQALRDRRRGFAQSMVGLNQATMADPSLAILGRPSQNGAQAQNLFAQQQAAGAGAGPSAQFNPWNAYAADLYNTNYNAQAAADIATGNANSALWGAAISSGGQAAGMASKYMGCWLARSAFGRSDERWVMFRDWICFRGPRWLWRWYLRHGERAAAWLDRHAWLKPGVRAIMTVLMKGGERAV